jgi:predicted dinucleotide-binding enzyme
MPLHDHMNPGIVEDDRVIFSMGDDQEASVVVEVYVDALAAADPLFLGALRERFDKNRVWIADAASRKFDVHGADPKGVLRLTSADL